MWFRSDLRVHDNPALYHAMQQGDTLAVYFAPIEQWQRHNLATVKQDLILRQVLLLQKQLAELNVPLMVLAETDFDNLAINLSNWVAENNIHHVFFNHEYEWNEDQLTQLVCAKLSAKGVKTSAYHDQCMIAPGDIRNKQGGFYKVFTAFKNAYFADMHEKSRPLYPKPQKQNKLNIASDVSVVDESIQQVTKEVSAQQLQVWRELWIAGENLALEQLDSFIEDGIDHYHETRDIPSIEGTSKLSMYLAIGAISTRQCFQGAVSKPNGLDNTGCKTWAVELIWRDFYRHLMAAFPEICRYKPFKAHTDQLPWKQDDGLFKAWCEGKTGFPIVDAAMQQLNQTGWMHNRLRMVTAMFLTKHLFVDWRLGEQYFMSKLVDGDLASNNGGWQWSASTGVDAVPYFRIFNPTRQSQRFDENGYFIRRYLPQLAKLDDKSIHQPNALQAKQCGYPLPIVDHKTSVAETKTHFKQLSERETDPLFREYGLS
ncbi:MAG: deoxyribodipyrimidine photo-lyase [Gammaproteobacteria bacterium]|nr:deoxyribodipyrimidine photo-lyase [Gammaproteobacteria bacterium]